jgi:hypothetical protein
VGVCRDNQCLVVQDICGVAVVVLLGVLFAAANLVGLLIAHLWFVIDVMCWDSL